MAIKQTPKSVAMSRAVATGKQIDALLGGFKKASVDGIPATRNQATLEEISSAIDAATFKAAVVEAFGDEVAARLFAAADVLDGTRVATDPSKAA